MNLKSDERSDPYNRVTTFEKIPITIITNMVLQIEKGPLAELYFFQKLKNSVTDVRFEKSCIIF